MGLYKVCYYSLGLNSSMKKIPLFKPYMSWRARLYALRVLMGDMIGEGPVVKQFEKEFSEYTGLKNIVAVNSGTAALELAYEIADVGPGDEVITPCLTCTASNLPILHHGATPVFADVDSSLCIDPNDIERRITDKTKAIVYVHFGGFSGNLKAVQEIASRHGIPVIEDAAQSVGADGWGTSEFTCVSLQAIKNLTSVDGGFIICRDDNDSKKAKRLRWFGYDRELKHKLGDTDLIEAGYKYHMSDLTAAIGLGNLRSLDKNLEARRLARRYYGEYNAPLLIRNWLIILVHERAEQVNAALKGTGIQTSGYHYRNDKYTIFGGRRNDLPYMDSIEGKYTLLPFHHKITKADVKTVMDIVDDVINK